MMSLRSPARSTITSFSPYFRVSSWDAVNPIMQEWLNRTALHGGWDNFGWSRRGDQLMWRSQFDDVDSMLSSFGNLTPLMDAMLQEASLDRFEFVGPAAQMARIQAETENTASKALRGLASPEYAESMEDVQTGYFRKSITGPGTSDEPKPNMLCTMTPHYKIKDWDAARPLMQTIIDTANAEPGCSYFGWTKRGDQLQSRETFLSGDSMKTHIEKVKPLIDALKAGPATLERLEISAPTGDMSKIEAAAASLEPAAIEYFGADAGLPQVEASKEGTEKSA